MSDAKKEIDAKIAQASDALEAILEKRRDAEKTVTRVEAQLREKKQEVASLADQEGVLRKNLGDLKEMRDAFDDPTTS